MAYYCKICMFLWLDIGTEKYKRNITDVEKLSFSDLEKQRYEYIMNGKYIKEIYYGESPII